MRRPDCAFLLAPSRGMANPANAVAMPYNNSRRFASTGRIPPKMNLPRRDCSAVLLGRGTRMLLFASSAGGYRTPFLGSQEPCSLRTRSEEHTSELQSRLHLVCRLLLEKKKTYT